MLNIHKASIFFQGEPLFSNITFRLGNGDRVGLIGKNGARFCITVITLKSSNDV